MATLTCPKCGAPIRSSARFCPSCRYPLAQTPASPPTAPTIICPSCGTTNRANAKFCASCRAALASPPGQPQVQPLPPVPQPITPPTPPTPYNPPPLNPPQQYQSRSGCQMRFLYLALAAALTLCLCISTSGVVVYEMMNPTATRTTVSGLPTTVTTPTSSPTITLTPTRTPTFTPPPRLPTDTAVPRTPAPALPTITRAPTPTPNYPRPVIDFRVDPDGRFGVFTTIGDPARNDDNDKRLTYATAGNTSNTRLFVDGGLPIFGGAEGTIVTPVRTDGAAKVIAWEYLKVLATQRLTIVQGSSTNRFDTLRIEYVLENRDTRLHQVGLRIMIDTLIGNNDGVPFEVPGQQGQQGIVKTAIDLRGKDIPDFFRVLENPSMANSGVVINVTLNGNDATLPERILITGWPGQDAEWDYLARLGGVGAPLGREGRPGGEGDSAVALFYPTKVIAPGEKYIVVAYYGLGEVQTVPPPPVATIPGATPLPALGVSIASTQVELGGAFWVLARVDNPQAGQRLTLTLPPQLELAEGQLTVPIAPEANAPFTTRSWLVRAKSPGANLRFAVKLEPLNLTQEKTLDVVAPPPPTPTRTPTATVPPTGTPLPTATPTQTRSVVQ